MRRSRAPKARPITERARRTSTSKAEVTLAVYHASADVERHLASLRQSKRFRLACFPQHSGPLRVAKSGFDGVLWELGKRSRPDRRRLGSIARRLPVVSYSAETGQELQALSHRAGFRSHLTAPLEPRAVEREIGTSRTGDLAARLRAFARGLATPANRSAAFEAVVRATTTTRVPERMAAHIVEAAFTWFGGHAWAVVGASDARGLQWLAERGVTAGQRASMLEIAERAVRAGKAAWYEEAPVKGRARKRVEASALVFPLRSHGRMVGALVGLEVRAEGAAAPEFDAREPLLVPVLALIDSLACALDVALRLKRANTLSSIDDLTGLFNSRFLAGALRREVKRAVRTKRPLSILFVDLDGFKGINDRYGHLCGSRALVEAGERILSGARETDIVARFGGDEFALILPETGREGAMLVARRVRERVAGHSFLADESIGYRLTASVGAATLPDCATTPETLLAAADTAMYRVKGRGKDGIEMAQLQSGPPAAATPDKD
jgi:diguanylate cyclase (GGDEF)-like protein